MINDRLNKIKFAKDCKPNDRVIVIGQKQYDFMIKQKEERNKQITEEIVKLNKEKAELNYLIKGRY